MKKKIIIPFILFGIFITTFLIHINFINAAFYHSEDLINALKNINRDVITSVYNYKGDSLVSISDWKNSSVSYYVNGEVAYVDQMTANIEGIRKVLKDKGITTITVKTKDENGNETEKDIGIDNPELTIDNFLIGTLKDETGVVDMKLDERFKTISDNFTYTRTNHIYKSVGYGNRNSVVKSMTINPVTDKNGKIVTLKDINGNNQKNESGEDIPLYNITKYNNNGKIEEKRGYVYTYKGDLNSSGEPTDVSDDSQYKWEAKTAKYFFDDNGILKSAEGSLDLIGAQVDEVAGSEGIVEFNSDETIKDVWSAKLDENSNPIIKDEHLVKSEKKLAEYSYSAEGISRIIVNGTIKKDENGNPVEGEWGVVKKIENTYKDGVLSNVKTYKLDTKKKNDVIESQKLTLNPKNDIDYVYDNKNALLFTQSKIFKTQTDQTQISAQGVDDVIYNKYIAEFERIFYLYGKPIVTTSIDTGRYNWVEIGRVKNVRQLGPTIQGILLGVEKMGEKFYASVDVKKSDFTDGKGFQIVENDQDNQNNKIFVEIEEALASGLTGKIGEKILFAGDVTSDIDGNLTMTMNSTYGSGFAIGDKDIKKFLNERKKESWYLINKAQLERTWQEIQTKYGDHSDWKKGFEFLKKYFSV